MCLCNEGKLQITKRDIVAYKVFSIIDGKTYPVVYGDRGSYPELFKKTYKSESYFRRECVGFYGFFKKKNAIYWVNQYLLMNDFNHIIRRVIIPKGSMVICGKAGFFEDIDAFRASAMKFDE